MKQNSSESIKSSIPSVSVVIPAFNAEETIERTLKSVVAQTLPVDEIVVVDDGSRDSTCEVIREFGHNVKLISQENTGPAGARNHGIAKASSDWIAFLDADDAWMPEKMELQAVWLNEDIDLVRTFDSNVHGTQSEKAITFDSLWEQNVVATSSVVVRKCIVEEIGGFNTDRRLMGVEDYNLWLRLTAKGLRSHCVAKPLVDYTPAENNLSSRMEHILTAELFNIDEIQRVVSVPEADVRRKQAALYDEYAMSLLHARDLPAARRCFLAGLRNRCTSRLALGWIATFLPTPLLNLKRWAMAK